MKQEPGTDLMPQPLTRGPTARGGRKRALSEGDISMATSEAQTRTLELEIEKTDLHIQRTNLQIKKVELQQRLHKRRGLA